MTRDQDSLDEALGLEGIELLETIIAKGQHVPTGDVPIENPEEGGPADAPKAPGASGSVTRFGWIKERHPWGIRVDFRPCSGGGLTDVFAQNLVDIQDVGWRGCSSGGKWYKSIIRYRT